MKRKLLALFSALILLIPAFPGAGSAASLSRMPYKAVAYMEIEFNCGCKRTGTGTMVSRYTLLTAGHNLLCSEHNLTASAIEFWFGYTSGSDYHYRYTGKFTYRYYCNFSNGFNTSDDIGYVTFQKAVGDSTGWFGTRWYSVENSLSGVSAEIIGYSHGSLKTASGDLRAMNSKQVAFRRGPEIGAVGGPVYYLDGSVYRLVAVYTSYTDSEYYARRLTENIFNDIKRDDASFN